MNLRKEDYYKFSYSFENSARINSGYSQIFCRRQATEKESPGSKKTVCRHKSQRQAASIRPKGVLADIADIRLRQRHSGDCLSRKFAFDLYNACIGQTSIVFRLQRRASRDPLRHYNDCKGAIFRPNPRQHRACSGVEEKRAVRQRTRHRFRQSAPVQSVTSLQCRTGFQKRI